MIGKASLVLSSVLCLFLVSSSCERLSRSVEDSDYLFLDNLVEEDLKDEGIDDLDTSAPSDKPAAPESSGGDCSSPAARRNTDRYVDKVIEEVRPKLPEPFFLPERVGRFRLFNGTLSNVVSMKRSGPALVRCADDTFSFMVPVSMTNLTGRYFWSTDAGNPVFQGLIDMVIERVDADVLYTRVQSPKDGQPRAKVDKLTITSLSGVKVEYDGLGPLNVIASRFTSLAVRFFSRGVSRALEGPVRNAINKELENVEKYEIFYY